jgi:DNA polymerase III subunit alpha
MLGLYVSDHPLFGTERVLERHTDATCASCARRTTARRSPSAGCSPGLTKKFTRKGDTYLVATLEDLSGNVEVVFWPGPTAPPTRCSVEDAVLVVTGRLEVRDEAVKLTANKVAVPDLSEALGAPVVVSFAAEQCTADAVRRLKDVLANHTGVVPVHLRVRTADGSAACTSSVTTCASSDVRAVRGDQVRAFGARRGRRRGGRPGLAALRGSPLAGLAALGGIACGGSRGTRLAPC